MYGLEGILGNLVTSVATPAIGGLAGDFITKEVVDNTMPQLLKEMTQTTVGALSGAAVGAGLGAITGGRTGAISGALTGGVGGGLGGYHAPEISQMFGMNQTPPQGVGAPPPMQPQASTMPFTSTAQQNAGDPVGALLQPKQSPAQLNAVRSTLPPATQQSPIQDFNAQIPPTQVPTAPTAPPSEYTGYVDFLKKNYEPLAGGFFLGSAYGANQDTQDQTTQNQQEDMLAELLKRQRNKRFSTATWGKAEGGPVEVSMANPQISVHFPAWAQEDIQREGGLAALQPGIRQGMAEGGTVEEQVAPYQSVIDRKAAEAVQQQEAAEGRSLSGSEKRDIYDSTRTRILSAASLGLGHVSPSSGLGAHISGLNKLANGGYVNTHPFDPQDFHPQSQIPSAQPYAGAAPTSVINTLSEGASFGRGGLIDGAGDGMSDDIPANISGKEEVRVADGEYVIPREIAAKYGPEKLKHMMAKVRAAAHAKKGKQIVQGAAQREFIKSLTGVKA